MTIAAQYDSNANLTADVDAAVAASAGLRLIGFACRESGGSPAVAAFNIVDGATAAGGTTVVPVELGGDESKSGYFGDEGIACPNGISIDLVTGTVDVVLYYKN